MNRWPIWVLACLAFGGCQTGPASVSNEPCPNINPCDDTDSRLRPPAPLSPPRLPPGPTPVPVAAFASGLPLWPGCPTTLQVMATPHRITFHAVRPSEEPETTDPDPSDWVCEEPEAPLLRAGRAPEHDLAVR
jgi:hypothetical protein